MKNLRFVLWGAAHDLAMLPDFFRALDHKVTVEDGRYLLSSPLLERCEDLGRAREIAVQLIERIITAAKLQDPDFGSVRSNQVEYTDADGKIRRHSWAEPKSITIRVRAFPPVLSVDGVVRPPPPAFPERVLELALRDRSVDTALMYLRLPQQTWGSLYSVYEIIREDLDPNPKNWRKLTMLGVSEAEVQRFRDTANDREHTGIHSRHGQTFGKRIEGGPMSLGEAEKFIRRMLRSWIKKKLAASP